MSEDECVKRHIAAVAVLALTATGCGLFGGGDDHKAQDAAAAFLNAWAAGNIDQAGQDTDNPAAAQAVLQKLKETLAPSAANFAVGAVSNSGSTGTAAFHAKLTVRGLTAP